MMRKYILTMSLIGGAFLLIGVLTLLVTQKAIFLFIGIAILILSIIAAILDILFFPDKKKKS